MAGHTWSVATPKPYQLLGTSRHLLPTPPNSSQLLPTPPKLIQTQCIPPPNSYDIQACYAK